jgi:hypothetical protein
MDRAIGNGGLSHDDTVKHVNPAFPPVRDAAVTELETR